MQITINYFGPAREALGMSSEALDVDEGLTVDRLLEELPDRHPELETLLPACRVALGTRYASGTEEIEDRAEVSLIPPVAGG